MVDAEQGSYQTRFPDTSDSHPLFLIDEQVQAMRNDGWMNMPSFKPFVDTLKIEGMTEELVENQRKK